MKRLLPVLIGFVVMMLASSLGWTAEKEPRNKIGKVLSNIEIQTLQRNTPNLIAVLDGLWSMEANCPPYGSVSSNDIEFSSGVISGKLDDMHFSGSVDVDGIISGTASGDSVIKLQGNISDWKKGVARGTLAETGGYCGGTWVLTKKEAPDPEPAHLAAEAERKRREEKASPIVLEPEHNRNAEARQRAFAKFEQQAVANLKDVQMFIKEKPTSPDLLAISTAAVGLKKSLDKNNGKILKAQIKVFEEKAAELSDFNKFHTLRIAKREQEAKVLAAKKAKEDALIITEIKSKLTTYRKGLVTMLSNSISKDISMSEALILIIRMIESGHKSTVRSEVSNALLSVEKHIMANTKIKAYIDAKEPSPTN